MSEKPKAFIKLQIPAGQANPSPPVGPALGQNGVNIMEFCKAFNDKTKSLEPGLLVPVVISVFKGGKFSFITKTPPASVLIKKKLKLKKGSGTPNTVKVGKISKKELEEIAEMKMPDLTAKDLAAAVKTISGSARSMGIDVE